MTAIIMGVDPGITAANPCALVAVDADRTHLVARALFAPPASQASAVDTRIAALVDWLHEQMLALCAMHNPVCMGVETAHLQTNVQTMRVLAMVGGAVLAVAARHAVPGVLVEPSQSKVALTGWANAGKDDMIVAVKQQFGVTVTKDEADACAHGLAGWAIFQYRQRTMQATEEGYR